MPDDHTSGSVVLLIVTYNSRPHIGACIESVRHAKNRCPAPAVVVVDNHSTDGTADFVADRFGYVDLLRLPENRGFSGGCNRGWEHVRQAYPNAPYLMLLNPDTVVGDGWLDPLTRQLDITPRAAAVQPKILLHQQNGLINTAGNRSHFLGFGSMTGYQQLDRGQYDRMREIDFASGAAVMLRRAVINKVGLFEEGFFMYLEDADLSWKLRQQGAQVLFVPQSVVFHEYQPTAIDHHYTDLERNRWVLLLTYYRWRTLVVLGPALFLMEIGQLLYGAATGHLWDKFRSYANLLSPGTIGMIARRRRTAKRARVLSDRDFMGEYSGTLELPAGSPWLLRRVANPLFSLYWKIVGKSIRW